MSDWIQLRDYVEAWVDEQLEAEPDPLTHALIERDRQRIAAFVEATMLRQMGVTNSGEWLQ